MKQYKALLYFVVINVILSCSAQDRSYKNYNNKLSELIEAQTLDESAISVLIDKSNHKLTVLIDTLIVKEYPVVFGGNPVDDKLKQGDRCTPEGKFRMLSKYPHKSWSKFIWINFPNNDSWEKHNQAKQDGKIPKDANIGGEIGIHGVPENMDILIDLKYNWTLGCISLKNKDVDEIYPYITENTIIEIRK
ncbi:MAG: L,D-transpeptidase [Bacteroidales bacterium]|nr:L,D-transpeptidase [Bacteroidales bacterium]